jgi:hypothetical protein
VDSSDSVAAVDKSHTAIPFYQVVLQCLIEYPCRACALHSPMITFSHAIRVGAVQVVRPRHRQHGGGKRRDQLLACFD